MSLKKSRAWFYFASYIKQRDAYKCFTCGKMAKGQAMGAGHFIQAFGNQNTFFEETNVHAQCTSCNLQKSGNLLEYRRRIIKKYGVGYDLKLEKMARVYKQWRPKELKELVKIYKGKLE